MMLNAVVLVLREVLEAAVLASLLLAIGKYLKIHYRWFLWSLLTGLIGAIIYASNLASISELMNYTGQEIVNSGFHIIIFLCALLLVLKISFHRFLPIPPVYPMIFCLATAITLEGSEIYLFVSAFVTQPETFFPVFTGGIIGAAIGISVGILFYFLITYYAFTWQLVFAQTLLAILVAGILSQTVPLLVQADIVTSYGPVWDSSSMLAENSIPGQLLYAITGYEATPEPLQIALHLIGLLLMACPLLIHFFCFDNE